MSKLTVKTFLLGRKRVKVTDEELLQIEQIADRATKIRPELDHTEVMMDIMAVHTSDCPLQLKEMTDAAIVDDFNFMHDIYGIAAHLNRETLKLERCFLPRCNASNPRVRRAA